MKKGVYFSYTCRAVYLFIVRDSGIGACGIVGTTEMGRALAGTVAARELLGEGSVFRWPYCGGWATK
jgi:hypothetical protein